MELVVVIQVNMTKIKMTTFLLTKGKVRKFQFMVNRMLITSYT